MSKRKIWNLYNDDTIVSMKNIFNIYGSNDIEEFWLYFQENCLIENEDITYLVIKYLFDYTAEFLEKVDSFDIIIEHAPNIQYITFWHQKHTDMLKQTYVDLKNYSYFNLQIDDEKTTFQIIKTEEVICKVSQEYELDTKEAVQIDLSSKEELTVYDFVSKDDLISMREINDELLNQMFYISSSQVEEDKIETIIGELDTYISIFAKYKELLEISIEVNSFRNILEDNMQKIIENQNADLNLFFEGIISNLKNWTDMSFEKGITDINYYNASIASDISMIKQFLQIDEDVNLQEDDDIFF